ncbi:Putative cytochrome C-type biogenesis protein [hydrothermal vent metagenome]|uniref:Cytochrome C-type biogenesis protein n=1 Tax=hydrothermal vent metagenome TaxID=652676 RepID=A0A3B1EA44_9ZZZZ
MIIKNISNILFSRWIMLFSLALLGIGAAVATIIENDYGTSTARVLVYNNLWYEIVMVLAIVNLSGIIVKRKMWKSQAKFIFHFSFIVILIGASLTRYVGYEGIMHIKEGQTQSNMLSLEPYIQVVIDYNGTTYYNEFKKEFSAIGDNDFNYDIKFANKKLNISLADYKFAKKNSATMNLIGTKVTLEDESKVVKLVGQRGQTPGVVRDLFFKNDIKVILSYGSKKLTIPFAIKLNDFQLDRYPGSMSPSSYASEVEVIDKINNINFEYRIFMNSTLQYGGYQFFQSSYDQDEKGTILSVNNDPGTIPTYLGYFLLVLGLLMNVFDKKSRFSRLIKYTKQFNVAVIVSILIAIIPNQIYANDKVAYLNEFKQNSIETADKFGHLVTQSSTGRMKPLDSLNNEILRKLARKSSLLGMNANQIVLGMMSRPDIWRDVKMLQITTPKLKALIGIDKKRTHIAFNEIFDKNGEYKLKNLVEKASAMNPNKRGTFEKDIIKLDERLNIAYMVYYGSLFKIFPRPNDSHNHANSDVWYPPVEAINNFHEKDGNIIKMMIRGLINSVISNNYQEANKYIGLISQFQQKVGKDIIPSKNIIDNEILFNKINIFSKLTLAYILIGLIMFIVSFLPIFNKNLYFPKLTIVLFAILAILFALHTFGMAHRWYISGHAPWSNTYESLVYIAWSTMLAGVIFFRKSMLALSATVIMASIFMFTAHLAGIDPQITNLVPVLKSYWLTIHVSIITGSYGFLGIGASLGFMSLIFFIFRDPNKPHIDDTIKHITAINEIALIIGLSALVVGNFLGGIWANESWGRYWGWDPKETWAYISIICYVLVLHLRMIPKLNTIFIFSVTSTLAFSSILMTYFGVNFYLSGMHSYATGDPVPIPTWVYIMTTVVFLVIILASRKRNLQKDI